MQALRPSRHRESGSLMQGSYLSIFDATSPQGFKVELVRFAQQLGFDTISATVVIDRLQGEPTFISVDNTPPAYYDLFLDPAIGKSSPLTQHCKATSVPIAWGPSTYLAANCMEQWERQAPFGYCHGIALALHLPAGRHLLIGVDRDKPLPADIEEVTRMTASLQLFAAHAQEAAMRVLIPEAPHEKSAGELTPRELECLRWTMEGKTAWEVGRILGIAEHTAVRHLYNATRKLGGASKHHAVIKALRLGLIW